MSVTISFTRVTPEQLERAQADPGWAGELVGELAGEPGGELGQSWDGLEFLLDRAEVPLDVLVDGEALDDDGYLYAWDAGTVASTATVLAAVPWSRLATHYDPAALSADDIYPNHQGWSDEDIDELKDAYESLQHFFKSTAAGGDAAIMSHSF